MSRIILYISAASTAFVVGVFANWSMNTLGGSAVDTLYNNATIEVRISTVLPNGAAMPPSHCGNLIVSVASDGTLDLSALPLGTPIGTLKDTSALSATLRTILEERQAIHKYVDSLDLPLRAPEDNLIDKTVYIKAPRGMSYGEVADLIAVVKDAGAEPVGLIADRYTHRGY